MRGYLFIPDQISRNEKLEALIIIIGRIFIIGSVFHAEKREVDAPVFPPFEEARKGREISGSGVLHNKKRAGFYQVGGEDQRGYLFESRMIVRRIREDYIVGFPRACDEFEDVSFDYTESVVAKFILYRTDETDLGLCHLDGRHPCGSSRQELEGYRAGPGKEIADLFVLNILKVLYDVEDIFACEIRSRTGRYIFGWVETTSTVFASDYSHYMSYLQFKLASK